ncbi:hypothetical protein [Mycoplasma feriruminatoris]|nr:hypothetical protein [Mycoplasma feriruminatoris]
MFESEAPEPDFFKADLPKSPNLPAPAVAAIVPTLAIVLTKGEHQQY